MKIGRLDVAHSLKRIFELTGSYGPELGEGIVPTVQLFDLEQSPFGAVISWCSAFTVAAFAGQFSWMKVSPSAQFVGNGLVTIDEIWAASPAGGSIWIQPDVVGGLPAMGAIGAPLSMLQDAGTQRKVAEVTVQQTTSITGPDNEGTQVFLPTSGESKQIRPFRPWIVGFPTGGSGALGVVSGVVLQTISLSFFGRVHFTTAK